MLPESLPNDVFALVELLDKCFPHRCPKLGENPDEVQRYAGKRELVDLLLSRVGPEDEDERRIMEAMNWIERDE